MRKTAGLDNLIKKAVQKMKKGDPLEITQEWCKKHGIDCNSRYVGRVVAKDFNKFGLKQDNNIKNKLKGNISKNNHHHYIVM